MILVDTSVWIATFRKSPLQLESVVSLDLVVVCLPVLQEVLQGFGNEHAYRLARESMLAMPMVESPVRSARYLEAADLYRAGRRRALTIRSATDCLIAAIALHHDLEVLHADRDFAAIAAISGLRQRSIG